MKKLNFFKKFFRVIFLLSLLTLALTSCKRCKIINEEIQLADLPELEIPKELILDNSFPQGVLCAETEMPAKEALERILHVVAWQNELLTPSWEPALNISENLITALIALEEDDLDLLFSSISGMNEILNNQEPPADTLLWVPLLNSVPIIHQLAEVGEETVLFQGVATTTGLMFDININGTEFFLELNDAKEVKLTEDAQKKMKWRKWFKAIGLGEGALDGFCDTLNDADLTNGNKYEGFAGHLRFFYPKNSKCKKYTFIQLVQRECIKKGKKVKSKSSDWKIDVEIPKKEVKKLSKAQKAEWPKKHPCYQKMRTHPGPPYPSIRMTDTPGVERNKLPKDKMTITWRFKTYIVCCDPLKVIGRLEWGFKVEYPGGGKKGKVTEFKKDPKDTSKNLPRIEQGSDKIFDKLLKDWKADPNRECK